MVVYNAVFYFIKYAWKWSFNIKYHHVEYFSVRLCFSAKWGLLFSFYKNFVKIQVQVVYEMIKWVAVSNVYSENWLDPTLYNLLASHSQHLYKISQCYNLHRLFDIWFSFSSNATIICFKSVFSCFKTSTSPLSAVFSSSKYLALMAIWFSFNLLASRDLLAASLFLYLLAQYLLFFNSSSTNCFFLFLMIGWGFSSSSENLLVAGSKS